MKNKECPKIGQNFSFFQCFFGPLSDQKSIDTKIQLLDFFGMKYSSMSYNFGTKIQTCPIVKFC